MNWSHYQLAIFDFVANNSENGCVIAVPGSGKTTVASNSMTGVPPRLQIFFTCFNTTIRDDLQRKIDPNKEKKNIKIQNYNGFGMAACYKSLKGFEFDQDKTENILRYIILNNLDTKENEIFFNRCKNQVKRIVSLAKGELITNPLELGDRIPDWLDDFDIELKVPESQFVERCIQVYQNSIADKGHIDFDDQLFFPVFLDMPIRKFDIVFVDEYQDSNKVQIELIKRAINTSGWGDNGRIIAIGDPDQSIYSFRGCVPNAMDDFIQNFKAKELPLSISYRCSKAIVKEAAKIVPRIECSDTAKEGNVDTISTPEWIKRVTINDMVLCRTVAPLVKRCLQKIREGVPCYIKGKEIGDNLIILIEKLDPSAQWGGKSSKDLYHVVSEYEMKETNRLNDLGKESQSEAIKDKADQIRALIESPLVQESGNNSQAVIKTIETVFSDVAKNGIAFMSAHKSKGLESKDNGNVYILRPDLMPFSKSKNQEEEMRIKYVALTRGKNDLFYVTKEKGEK